MNMNHVTISRLHHSIFRKKRDSAGRLYSIFKDLYRTPQGFPLAVIDLAKIGHMFLHNAAATEAAVLNDAPIAVLFAVLEALCYSQEHSAIVYEIHTAAIG